MALHTYEDRFHELEREDVVAVLKRRGARLWELVACHAGRQSTRKLTISREPSTQTIQYRR